MGGILTAKIVASLAVISASPTVWIDEVEIASLHSPGFFGMPSFSAVEVGGGGKYGMPLPVSSGINALVGGFAGPSSFSSRAPALIGAVLAGIAVYLLLRLLGTSRLISAAALVILISDQIFASSSAGGRFDSVAIALALFAAVFLLRALIYGGRWAALLSGALASASLFTWFTSVLVLTLIPAVYFVHVQQSRSPDDRATHRSVSLWAGASFVVNCAIWLVVIFLPSPRESWQTLMNGVSRNEAGAGLDFLSTYAALYNHEPWLPVLYLCGIAATLLPSLRHLWPITLSATVAFVAAAATYFYGGRLVYGVPALVILLALAVNELPQTGKNYFRYGLVAMWIFACASFAIEPGARAVNGLREADQRSYSRVSDFIGPLIQPGDRVFGVYPAYYAVLNSRGSFVGRFDTTGSDATIFRADSLVVRQDGVILDDSQQSAQFLESLDVLILPYDFAALPTIRSADGSSVFQQIGSLSSASGPVMQEGSVTAYAFVAYRRAAAP